MNAGQHLMVMFVYHSQLPSAVESGRRSPTSVFTIDLVDFDTVAQNETVLDRFLEESGHSDPALLRPPTEIVESDDKHDLDLDAGSVEGDADSLCSPLCLSSLVEDPHLMDMELLNACVNTIDPASHALYNMQFKLNEMGVDHYSVYEEVAMPSDHECGHVDGGSMATTTNKLELLHHYVAYPES
jgi:hypothetical protein